MELTAERVALRWWLTDAEIDRALRVHISGPTGISEWRPTSGPSWRATRSTDHARGRVKTILQATSAQY
jgi:hypothetical protein